MIPYLSRQFLEQMTEPITRVYFQSTPRSDGLLPPVDMTDLAERILRLRVQYFRLCDNGTILGLTAFAEFDLEFDLVDGTTECLHLRGNDIVIDSALQTTGKRGRRNFTVGHEAAHHILYRRFPNEYGPVCHRQAYILYRSTRDQHNRAEWQADSMASTLLMPRALVFDCMRYFGLGTRIEVLNRIFRSEEFDKFVQMANYMGVSKQALCIRLKQLNLLGKEYLASPYDLVNVYKDDDEI